MARYTAAVCRMCRREGVKLFLKGTRCDTNKCAVERRQNAAGMHSYRRGKLTDYGLHLREKQKVKPTTASWNASSAGSSILPPAARGT